MDTCQARFPPSTLAAIGWIGTALVMAGLWARQLRTRNAALVDAGWTLAVGGLSAFFAVAGDGWPARRAVIAGLVVAWSARLGLYLLRDRVLGRPEDGRYAVLRQSWGDRAPQRFFWFFQAQALAALFFALPAFIASHDPRPHLHALEILAVALWLIGFSGEALADWQLARFKRVSQNRGRTCQQGLWRYSRHPNYFFEWTMWVAYAVFTLASPWGLAAALCPLTMLYLLLRVTGIPATEAQAVRTRGDEYVRYQHTTSTFFPWVRRA